MQRGSYRLARHIEGIGHLAEVSVRADPAATACVAISNDVFGWLKNEYGPDAWEWSVCDAYREAARDGVQFALDHSTPSECVAVTIEEIRGHPAHTTGEAVTCAAAHATWKALGATPTALPTIGGVEVPDKANQGSSVS